MKNGIEIDRQRNVADVAKVNPDFRMCPLRRSGQIRL
jgi:hypothetical protein